ncbi:Uncharacterized protein PECH_002416 [Penicillium ucsense]|uniref:RING-type domain-containing protein n=1 Tax=Penicillium ucsense TaxID=2839758 RepID=A0A8J8W6Z5_9EURO|nr:Uncharacterized protein PECM_003046 [Penicillium ucsense]KAF7737952.1 Uncharacterized protein PECH_002416 [Penicillium ucsense]
MVLSLPVPSFSRSSPPRPADDTSASQDRRQRGSASSASSSSGRSTWKLPLLGSHSSGASTASSHPSITLSEALRNNPFGNTSRSRSLQVPQQCLEDAKREQDECNAALETLASTFPDIRIEVFRELLLRFDGESRLHVCVDQLLRHEDKWVQGRRIIPEGHDGTESDQKASSNAETVGPAGETVVPVEERFRSEEYKAAVQTTCIKEFGSLSKSAIDAVLAEANFSYRRARPTLQDLSRRTWRATFNSILPFRRKKDREEHPNIVWHRRTDNESTPVLKETGCAELDAELVAMFITPVTSQRRNEQENADFRFASDLNELEAKALDYLYECECCCVEVPFEQIATCTSNVHAICYNCIQRTVQEAVFGQGWAKSVDMARSTLKCLAPLAHGVCDGSLPAVLVKQAVLQDKAGNETYAKFEARVASEVLIKSRMRLVRCPFCSYAEADPIYYPYLRDVRWQVRRSRSPISSIIVTLFMIILIPLLLTPCLIILLVNSRAIPVLYENAIRHLCLKARSKRFICANPSCQRVSCNTCQRAWRDPHVCYEPLLTSLRATVEAARTAAVKRTCPRCGLSFVKSSGCNKLTCVCGYSMCYLCRKRLGPKAQPAQARGWPASNDQYAPDVVDGPGDRHPGEDAIAGGIEDDEFEEPDGYEHFCQHFRLNPGSQCSACTKCELYKAEDEEAVARRAGERAEREWHLRQRQSSANGAASEMPLFSVNSDLSAGSSNRSSGPPHTSGRWDLNPTGRPWRYWLDDVWVDGRWKLEGQRFVNWIAEQIIIIEEA